MAKKYRLETMALHAGTVLDETTSLGVPIHRTSSYQFRDTDHAANLFALKELGNIYTRLMNPTHDVLEKRVAEMEGGAAALALASGTSAIFYSVINVCSQGDEVVASKYLYGGTYTMFNDILPEMGITVRFVDPSSVESIEEGITDKTRMLFAETIGNPGLDVTNIEVLSTVAEKHKIPLAIDSTFTSPYLFRPIEHGAHIVIHSLTKWMGGHGTGIGGIVVDSGTFNWQNEKFKLYNTPENSYHGLTFARDLGDMNPIAFILRMRLIPLRNLGACISPDNAWMFLQGLETLHLRMQRHCDNAMKVAAYLKEHDEVTWVRYPGLTDDPSHEIAKKQFDHGFGSMVIFGIRGGRDSGEKFINNLELFSHVANVGDAKSLAIHPATTTHSQMSEEQQEESGISPDMVRLSVGIEHIDDIIGDIEDALKSAGVSV